MFLQRVNGYHCLVWAEKPYGGYMFRPWNINFTTSPPTRA